MRKLLMLLTAWVLMTPQSHSATLSVKFINKTGQALKSITATPIDGDVALNLIAAPLAADAQPMAPVLPAIVVPSPQVLAAAATASKAAAPALLKPTITPPVMAAATALAKPPADPARVTFTAPDKTCVFNLAFTLASGKVSTLPDADLCQTDQIIVE
jgi:hypothetical protein